MLHYCARLSPIDQYDKELSFSLKRCQPLTQHVFGNLAFRCDQRPISSISCNGGDEASCCD